MKPLDYATMPIAEIAALPVPDFAADDCAMYLWTTNTFLPEALGIVRIWRFEYRMLWTWCKPTGMGAHPRNATEHIVIAHRGRPGQILPRTAPQTLNWLRAPVGGHSEKPAAFMDTIEAISPSPRLELFARSQRLGWDSWGNEALNHVTMATP